MVFQSHIITVEISNLLGKKTNWNHPKNNPLPKTKTITMGTTVEIVSFHKKKTLSLLIKYIVLFTIKPYKITFLWRTLKPRIRSLFPSDESAWCNKGSRSIGAEVYHAHWWPRWCMALSRLQTEGNRITFYPIHFE